MVSRVVNGSAVALVAAHRVAWMPDTPTALGSQAATASEPEKASVPLLLVTPSGDTAAGADHGPFAAARMSPTVSRPLLLPWKV